MTKASKTMKKMHLFFAPPRCYHAHHKLVGTWSYADCQKVHVCSFYPPVWYGCFHPRFLFTPLCCTSSSNIHTFVGRQRKTRLQTQTLGVAPSPGCQWPFSWWHDVFSLTNPHLRTQPFLLHLQFSLCQDLNLSGQMFIIQQCSNLESLDET